MISSVDPSAHREARLQVHHAAQVAAAAGNTLLPHHDDHRNRNLGWSPAAASFLGRPVGALQAGIRVGDLAWVIVSDEEIVASFGARGYTQAQGLAWLRHAWSRAGGVDTDFDTPGYDIPEHPVADDGHYGGQTLHDSALQALAASYAAAVAQLEALRRRHDGSEVRLWPHHLDVATLITVSGEGEDGRSVGISFTPGDGHIDQPYYSVSPWPYPRADALPDLDAGGWHTDGFTAAVLRSDQGADRADVVSAFLQDAVEKCLSLVRP